MGKVNITAYVRYNSTTGKYTYLKHTYTTDFSSNYPGAYVISVTCNYTADQVMNDDIRFTVLAASFPGINWKEYPTIEW